MEFDLKISLSSTNLCIIKLTMNWLKTNKTSINKT